MEDEIKKLITEHKRAKDEVFYLIQELKLLDLDKMSQEEVDTTLISINKLEEEKSLRLGFISDLESLL